MLRLALDRRCYEPTQVSSAAIVCFRHSAAEIGKRWLIVVAIALFVASQLSHKFQVCAAKFFGRTGPQHNHGITANAIAWPSWFIR